MTDAARPLCMERESEASPSRDVTREVPPSELCCKGRASASASQLALTNLRQKIGRFPGVTRSDQGQVAILRGAYSPFSGNLYVAMSAIRGEPSLAYGALGGASVRRLDNSDRRTAGVTRSSAFTKSPSA
ncbi:MAG: hypothetical protein ACO1SX_08740 [Actinomycetota bacterium]